MKRKMNMNFLIYIDLLRVGGNNSDDDDDHDDDNSDTKTVAGNWHYWVLSVTPHTGKLLPTHKIALRPQDSPRNYDCHHLCCADATLEAQGVYITCPQPPERKQWGQNPNPGQTNVPVSPCPLVSEHLEHRPREMRRTRMAILQAEGMGWRKETEQPMLVGSEELKGRPGTH